MLGALGQSCHGRRFAPHDLSHREGNPGCADVEVLAGEAGGCAACESRSARGSWGGGGTRREHGAHAVDAAVADAGSDLFLPHVGVFAGTRVSRPPSRQFCMSVPIQGFTLCISFPAVKLFLFQTLEFGGVN